MSKVVSLRKLFSIFIISLVGLSFFTSLLSARGISDFPRSYVTQTGDAQASNILYFGHVKDANPISSQRGAAQTGYCDKLSTYIEQQISGYRIIRAEVEYTKRFMGVGIHEESEVPLTVECGPNTIKPDREEGVSTLVINLNNSDFSDINNEAYPGTFSSAFFKTGAALLMKKGNDDENLKLFRENRLFSDFDNDSDRDERIIAVIGASNQEEGDAITNQEESDTTTNQLIRSIYPKAKIKVFESRDQVSTALRQDDNIIAYTSDHILLKGLLEDIADRSTQEASSYEIVPTGTTFSEEEYGIVSYETRYNSIGGVIERWLMSDEGVRAKNELEKRARRTFPKNFIDSWDKGKISSFWLILAIAAITPILLTNVVFPLLIYLFAKVSPPIFVPSIENIAKSNLYFNIISSNPKARKILLNRSLDSAISKLPEGNDDELKLKSKIEELNSIINGLSIDGKEKVLEHLLSLLKATQEPVEAKRRITSEQVLLSLRQYATGISHFNELVDELDSLVSRFNRN